MIQISVKFVTCVFTPVSQFLDIIIAYRMHISKRTFDWSLFCATICLGFSFLVIHSSNSSHACCVRVPLCFFCVRFVLFLYLFIIIGMSHGMEMKLN